MSPTLLSKKLGVDLQPCQEENPARCALSDQHGQYVLDDQQRIVGLNLFGYNGEKDRPALPSPANWLHKLPHLKYLNLAQCGLTALDLTGQTELVVLFAQENKALKELTFPTAFPALLRAVLDHCALTQVIWPDSPVLEFLNVSRQQEKSLTNWSFASACPRLYFCDLSHNGLTGFQLGAGFTNLGILCLEDNALTEVTFDGVMPGLESLRLSGNQLTILPANFQKNAASVKNLFLENNPWQDDIIRGLLEDSTPATTVNKLFDYLDDQVGKTDYDRACKVIIVGNGGVGKTNILNRLTGKDFDGKSVSTHGVNIVEHRIGEYDVQFWDFGGQDIYHATHRLFLGANVVYLVVWDNVTERQETSRREEKGVNHDYENFRLPYWLDYVYRSAARSGEAKADVPVLVVQTKVDDRSKRHEHPGYRKRFDQRFGYYEDGIAIDSETDAGYDDLKYHLGKVLKLAKKGTDTSPGPKLPADYLKIRSRLQALRKQGDKSINLTKYREEVCDGIKMELAPEVLLESWLHKTGVVFYQPGLFKDQIILDQEWATEAVYTLLDREGASDAYRYILARNGRFTGADLIRFWSGYNQSERNLFVDFMLSCWMCFEQQSVAESEKPYRHRSFEERVFIAPQLLPKEKPPAVHNITELLGSQENWWHVRYQHRWLHGHLMNRFIIETHQLAENDWMWESGILLKDDKGAFALIDSDRAQGSISVRVTKNKGKVLLDKVLGLLERIQQNDEPGVTYLSVDGEQEILADQLEQAYKTKTPYVISENGQQLPIDDFGAFFWRFDKPLNVDDFDGASEMANLQKTGQRTNKQEHPPILSLPPREYGDDDLAGKVLALCANPTNLPHLKFKKELAAMDESVRKGFYLGAPVFKVAQVDKKSFHSALRKPKPDYLHFVGHGTVDALAEDARKMGLEAFDQSGIMLCETGGNAKLLPKTTILNWLQNANLKLVVFNACHTAGLAEELSIEGPPAIGVDGEMDDNVALAFTEAFYEYLSDEGLQQLIQSFFQARNYANDVHGFAVRYQLYINGKQVTESI
ncbi:COR domain-containing protein [Neolewinella persica]|uniref:COR domain-containing protein n=1 Tax=Neolewinella persica TaxID=70998 RepID=UPI00037DC648|nr:COR domain-containing protein [Neolewinella persica]